MQIILYSMDSYFERTLNGPPFCENEDKKYEFCRLESFKLWPKDSPVYPLKLSKAGFFYSGQGDEVVCFQCSVKKSQWQYGEDPVEVHRSLNPECPFLLGENDENVPFHSRAEETPLMQRLNSVLEGRVLESDEDRESDDIPTDSSSILNGNGTVIESANREVIENSVTPQTSQNRSNQQQLPPNSNVSDSSLFIRNKNTKNTENQRNKSQSMQSSTKSSPTGSPSSSNTENGHDIPPPTGEGIGPLRFERNRLETFRNFPDNASISPAELAKQGFHYTGSADRVQCIFCKGILRNWEPGDRPHIEHRKHFPRCPFVLGMNIGNVPLPLDQSSAPSLSSIPRSQNQFNDNVIDSLTHGNAGAAANLGIVTDRPKHPNYAIESQRLSSFQGWPSYRHQTPKQLAEAGFFYAGIYMYQYMCTGKDRV